MIYCLHAFARGDSSPSVDDGLVRETAGVVEKVKNVEVEAAHNPA